MTTARELEGWSRAHAVLTCAACAAVGLLGRPALFGIFAALSFAVLGLGHRAAWAGRHWVPNAVTGLRVALTCAISVAFRAQPAWWIAVVAGCVFALDGVDGWLARRLRAGSQFGAHFDMEADACFILALEIELWQRGQLGAWVLTTGLLRYAYVLTLAVVATEAGPVPRQRFARYAFSGLVSGLILAFVLPGRLAVLSAGLASLPVTLSFIRAFHWSFGPRRRHG